MKKCGRCKQNKSNNDFNKKGSGLQPLCKECNKERSRAYYQRNKQEHIKRTAQNKTNQIKINKEYIRELKESTPCKDCGLFYPSCVMDFDHIKGKKMQNVSRMVLSGISLTTIKKEISKCEIVCANCHRIRTHITRGYS